MIVKFVRIGWLQGPNSCITKIGRDGCELGLSTEEARVAAALAFGKSINTIRVQPKAILEKTGTARQAELVRLLLNLPGFQARS